MLAEHRIYISNQFSLGPMSIQRYKLFFFFFFASTQILHMHVFAACFKILKSERYRVVDIKGRNQIISIMPPVIILTIKLMVY